MAKEVKIVSFRTTDTQEVEMKTPKGATVIRTYYILEDAEAALTKLVNEGWTIITAGSYSETLGFVVLQREAPEEEGE